MYFQQKTRDEDENNKYTNALRYIPSRSKISSINCDGDKCDIWYNKPCKKREFCKTVKRDKII